jgi:hypothetical protein
VLQAYALISSPLQGDWYGVSSRERRPKPMPTTVTLIGQVDDKTLGALSCRYERGCVCIPFNCLDVHLVPVGDAVAVAEAIESAVVGGIAHGQRMSFPTWAANAEGLIEVCEKICA